jgi:hypothetical protein
LAWVASGASHFLAPPDRQQQQPVDDLVHRAVHTICGVPNDGRKETVHMGEVADDSNVINQIMHHVAKVQQ